ncbi:2-amino-4-oxopentanoate thiolase subunit OrtA [Suipraeoptans intestinalis]|uniref:2-amino-4-oxopentanoate thiolase subunit OrtA n=1 Tax=Suipraeoptans intestinalis TaxID=2606628 RepID=UPI002A747C41|nr:2-amino-4-oxopentanoate thiolase subunit OrtA [Suipraeoptans intestinalis]MDY3121292.1 2-amino-4-oxopentanoate thiolase subunit OrtA [Suipraeoptans intestinalis]
MFEVKKGDWVEIETIVLPAYERAPQVPEDTMKCSLKMWVKGEACEDKKEGEEIEILTNTGRRVRGKLVSLNPGYHHDYGEFQPELIRIERQVKEILGGVSHE